MRTQTPIASLAVLAVLTVDIIVIVSTTLLVRMVIMASPLMDVTQPHWAAARYTNLGLLMALVFVLLAWAAGMYSAHGALEPRRLPAVNLLNWSVILVLGLYACRRYAINTEGGILLSKRILFVAGMVLYGITTVIHYGLGMLLHARQLKTEKETEL
jgi:hypothetical protein